MAQHISKKETTAVEWLIKEWPALKYQLPTWLIEQAKAMERQQLANSWDKACDQYIYRDGDLVKVWKDFDKYYNETYNK